MRTKIVFKASTAILAALVITMMLAGVSLAKVWTDQQDYMPGSVVTIHGDNSDGAGYLAGETVHVSVVGPNDYFAACDGVADTNGAWSCQVELWGDPAAVGTYAYTAIGQTSGVSQSGMFTDNVISVSITSPTGASPVTVTSLPANVTIAFNYSTSDSGTTTGEAYVLGVAFNTKTLASGSGKSDSIVVTIPTGTANGSYNTKVQVTNSYGSGATNKTDVSNNAIIVNVPADTTPPVIIPTVSGTLGNNDWYVSDVNVSWSVTDSQSPITSQTGCSSTTITSDTAGTTLTCSATSAGGTSSQSVTIKRDATPPTISAAATTAPNGAGWYNSDVTVHFTCSDALSGIPAGACPADQTLSTEGAAVASTAQTVTDAAGNTSAPSNVVTVSIDKTAPTTTNMTANPNPAPVNTTVTLGATLNDSGGSGIASAQYSLNGTWQTPVPVGQAMQIGPFSTAQVLNVCVRAIDVAGNTGLPECLFLAVYDPSGGFVTGGGWINSPAGAYTPNPSLTGKATFGFVSKYQKGANVPTGNTEFQFHVANFNFKSTSYEWLVVSGARAQYKGSGTVNGAGNFSFILTAIDGQVNGGGGVDKFRIKIWDSGGIVYDNQMNAPDTADPATVLAGGSIVVHK